MAKLHIPKNHSGLTKTIRIPEDMVAKIQSLSELKNLSFNKTVTALLKFSLENLDEPDKGDMEKNANDQHPI